MNILILSRRYTLIVTSLLSVLLLIWLVPKIVRKFKEQTNLQTGFSTSVKENANISSEIKSGFEMVTVKGGSFLMGSPSDEKNILYDECEHDVTVSSFNIGKYEVTQADWYSVMGKNPPETVFKNCDQCPVEQVSWDDVQDFIRKLNLKYPGRNYRLPTEAEWEYAARGGDKSHGFNYAGSNDLNEVAWNAANSASRTHPVGEKLPNELGLYDMTGNVWEWCQDLYWAYPDCAMNGSVGAGYVQRGGSWFAHTDNSGVSKRGYSEPSKRGAGFFGFRLLVENPDLKQPTSKDSVISDFVFDYPSVQVAGGIFQMGNNTIGNKVCQHPVTLNSFSIGKHEVTQAQWKAIMGNNPSSHKDCDECPVENVSWIDIHSFISILNEKTNKNYRLPTEAEWEYAAQGGRKSRSYKYAGSNDLNKVAWYESISHPVGQKDSNELGLYDMSGNVMEWCQDSYKSYPCDANFYRRATRIVRGGGGLWPPLFCLVSHRTTEIAEFKFSFVGFRLAHE